MTYSSLKKGFLITLAAFTAAYSVNCAYAEKQKVVLIPPQVAGQTVSEKIKTIEDRLIVNKKDLAESIETKKACEKFIAELEPGVKNDEKVISGVEDLLKYKEQPDEKQENKGKSGIISYILGGAICVVLGIVGHKTYEDNKRHKNDGRIGIQGGGPGTGSPGEQ